MSKKPKFKPKKDSDKERKKKKHKDYKRVHLHPEDVEKLEYSDELYDQYED
jgi:hypothetical protein